MTGGETPAESVTVLLRLSRQGEPGARDRLFEHVDAEVRQIARAMLRAKGLSPSIMRGTELVNDAYARLLGREELEAEDRAHFFFLIGRAMHDTLVEEARSAKALKRGGGRQREPMIEIPDRNGFRAVLLVEVTEALNALRAVDAHSATALEHHYLAGHSLRQTAELMQTSLHNVRQHVAYGSVWLRARLAQDEKAQDSAHRDEETSVDKPNRPLSE
ncbi:MAG: ECF-type sigma factor [Planctomycetota bacterium]